MDWRERLNQGKDPLEENGTSWWKYSWGGYLMFDGRKESKPGRAESRAV